MTWSNKWYGITKPENKCCDISWVIRVMRDNRHTSVNTFYVFKLGWKYSADNKLDAAAPQFVLIQTDHKNVLINKNPKKGVTEQWIKSDYNYTK